MRKEHIIWFLFPLLWMFCFFFMRGHIVNWEETNFFQNGMLYWHEFLLKPGGWLEYVGYFLLQFYRQLWIGALIVTLLPLGVFVLTRDVLRRLGVVKHHQLLSVLPSVLMCSLICDQQTVLGDLLKIFVFYLFIWGYGRIVRPRLRGGLFTLLYPVAFLLLGGGVSLCLYVILGLIEALKRRGSGRWVFIGLWLIVAVGMPAMWKQIYIMPDESLYRLSGRDNYSLTIIYAYTVLLLGLSQFRAWRQEQPQKKRAVWMQLGAVIVGCVAAIYYTYDARTEAFFRLEQAAERGDWEQVVKSGEKLDKPTREEMYLYCLALANRGELGERLFENPEWGIGSLYLPKELNYKNSVFGGELYYRLKIPNEAIHWTFQAAVASPQGMDFRTLRRLIELNVMKRDTLIADKYLTILENSWGNDRWCRERREELNSPHTAFVQPDNVSDFFIGGRPFLSDFARVLDAGRSKEMTGDYILCGLLLKKDLNKFCQLFAMCYAPNSGRIDKAYQEALLVAITVGNQSVAHMNDVIDPEISKRFEDYNALFRTCKNNKEQAKELMKNFKDTWWYYYHFVEPHAIDEKGHSVSLQYAL